MSEVRPPGRLTPGSPDSPDERILRWLTATEGASARPVLDVAFVALAHVRQQRRWPWTGFLDSLARPVSIRLPRWAWVVLALVLATALTMAALVGADRLRPLLDRLLALPVQPAQLSSAACPSELASSTSATCLVAAVASRHERPIAGTISLSVTEFRPAAQGSANGLTGIPILVFDLVDPLGEQTRLDFDRAAEGAGRPIVAVAPRRVGVGSASLACTEVDTASTSRPVAWLSDPTFRSSLEVAVRACRDRLNAAGVDVAAFDLSETAADIESIRAALGIDRWIVRARGREAPLALELLRRYPDSVAGVILVNPSVSAAGPNDPGTEALDGALHELSAMCAVDAFCAGHYRPPADAFRSVVARLATGPVAVVVQDASGADVTIRVDESLVRAAVRDALAGFTSVGTLPSLMDRMAAGNLAWPATRLVYRGWCLGSELACSPTSGWSGGAEFALWCAGEGAEEPLDIICPAWLGDEPRSPAGIPSNDEVPLLAVVGRTNPWVTVVQAEVALKGMSRSAVLDVPWVPEGLVFACLGSAGSNWFAAPGEVQVSSCPDTGAPMFGDAP